MSLPTRSGSFFQRTLAVTLAIAILAQTTLSCGPLIQAREAWSTVASKSDLDFDRANDSSTNLSEGGGWEREKGGKQNNPAPVSLDSLPPDTPWIMPMPDGGYIEFDGQQTTFVLGGAATLRGPTSGVPAQVNADVDWSLIVIPSGPGSGAPELRREPGGKQPSPGKGFAPSFPLNPGKLTTRSEVESDIAARLDEREKALEKRQKDLRTQATENEKKQSDQPRGALASEAQEARNRHSGVAAGVRAAADGAAGGSAPSPGEDTLQDRLPGGLSGDFEDVRRDARTHAQNRPNSYSSNLARHALESLDEAEQQARSGNMAQAENKKEEARFLASLAGRPGDSLPLPPPSSSLPPSGNGSGGGSPPGPGLPPDLLSTQTPAETRSEAMRTGLGLYDAASSLQGSGLADIASKTRTAARVMLEVAIGAARISSLLDLPLSVMEAFGGVTLSVDASDGVFFRDATYLEMAFGVAALGAAGLAFGAGGWTAVVGAGIVGGLGKAVSKGLEGRLGVKIAEELGDELPKVGAKVVEKLDNDGVELLQKWLRKKFPASEDRVISIIDAFVPGTIRRRVAPHDELIQVNRWFDEENGRFGSWVTPENFLDANEARQKLSVLDKWSGMKQKATFTLRPGSEFFSGKVAAQAPYKGGAEQFFLLDPDNSLIEVLQ